MEIINACFTDTVLAPELVPFRTVFGIGVCDDCEAARAAENHHAAHLVTRQFFLVMEDVGVGPIYYLVASLTVVDSVQY